MRYFLLLLLNYSVLHYTASQIKLPANGDIFDDIYKCDSIVGPKSTSPEELSYKNDYQYYPDGLLKSDISYTLKNNLWKLDQKYEYIYKSGKLLSEIRSNYDLFTKVWLQSGKTEYFYVSDSKLTKKLYYSFNLSTSSWSSPNFEDFVYSNQDLTVEATMSISRPSGLEKNSKLVTYRNRFNLIDSLIRYIYVDGILKISEKENYLYDSDGYMKSAVMMNDEYNPLQISSYREVTYNVNKNPSYIEKRPFQKASFKFDFAFDLKGNRDNTWLPLLPDDLEAFALFRHGLITEIKISRRSDETELWTETNEGGTFYYSRIDGLSSVINSNLNSSISIFPNPTSEVLNLVIYTRDNAPQSYSLKSAQGTIMQQELLLPNQSAINISEIPTGVYILELMVGNEKHFRKIVKN